jgi:hypothetical protein
VAPIHDSSSSSAGTWLINLGALLSPPEFMYPL